MAPFTDLKDVSGDDLDLEELIPLAVNKNLVIVRISDSLGFSKLSAVGIVRGMVHVPHGARSSSAGDGTLYLENGVRISWNRHDLISIKALQAN